MTIVESANSPANPRKGELRRRGETSRFCDTMPAPGEVAEWLKAAPC
jgi:hypothetical protein